MRPLVVSVSDVEVTSVVESDHRDFKSEKANECWDKDPAETCTAVAGTPNQILSLGANIRGNTDPKI